MITKLIGVLKKNWQLIIIVILVIVLIGRRSSSPLYKSVNSLPSVGGGFGEVADLKMTGSTGLPSYEAAPAPNVKDRLVVKNSTLSLLVNEVANVQKQIIQKTESLGGYMVDSNLNSPEGIKSGNVTVRIPAKKLEEALDFFRSLSIRVVSENLTGYDVTDQYVDIQARLEILNKTKAKFEEILNKAATVSEMMEVQRSLISLQDQIDSLKGQEDYLVKNADNARITVYLSTDELSLPYAPSQPWRPTVIFKQAVRSLVGALRGLGTLMIWIVVFSVIWLPTLIIYLLWRKRRSQVNN